MVEHVLIRLADLREEEALEQWARQHPLRERVRRSVRWLCIRLMLALRWVRSSPPWLRASEACSTAHTRLYLTMLSLVMRVSRGLTLPPPRKLASQLSTKRLLAELELRGVGVDGTVAIALYSY